MKACFFIAFFVVLFTACQHFMPKVRFSLMDLEGIKVYNVLLECDDLKGTDVLKKFTVCDGGVNDGIFYCDNVEKYDCKAGKAVFLTGFDSDSFPKVDSYIHYLVRRFSDE